MRQIWGSERPGIGVLLAAARKDYDGFGFNKEGRVRRKPIHEHIQELKRMLNNSRVNLDDNNKITILGGTLEKVPDLSIKFQEYLLEHQNVTFNQICEYIHGIAQIHGYERNTEEEYARILNPRLNKIGVVGNSDKEQLNELRRIKPNKKSGRYIDFEYEANQSYSDGSEEEVFGKGLVVAFSDLSAVRLTVGGLVLLF